MTIFAAAPKGQRNAIAACMAVAAIAASTGPALAISPTLQTELTFKGTVQIVRSIPTGVHNVFTVPASKGFVLTDLIAGNAFTTIAGIEVYVSTNGCNFVTPRTGLMIVPALNSLVVPLVTGIRFGGRQNVCINNPFSPTLHFTARGYLY